MKKNKKYFYGSLIAAMVMAFAIFFTSCNKDDDPVPNPDGLYTVSFGMSMYGEAVPWSDNGALKSFATFEHKWGGMVIRLYDDAMTWIVDLPAQTNNGDITYVLASGDYNVEFIPVLEDEATLIAGGIGGPYTVLDLAFPTSLRYSYDKAFAYTESLISFHVGALGTFVEIPVITDFGCVMLDLFGVPHGSAGYPEPSVVSIYDAAFLAPYMVPGNEEIAYADILTEVISSNVFQFARSVPVAGTDVIQNSFEYDAAAALYFMYTFPAGSNTLTFPVGDGSYTTPGPNVLNVHYFGFDFDGASGSSYPTLWMKDGLNGTATWTQNMTLQITFKSDGGFTLDEQPWFENIADGGTIDVNE